MSRVSRSESVRQGRIPVSSNRAPLVVKGFDHANFQGRWVNDIDDRIQMFLDAGYEFVLNDNKKISAGESTADSSKGLDSRVSKPVGRGVTAYLMRIPKQFYLEDQAAKEREIKETERAMLRPGKGSVSAEVDYGEVSMSSRKGGEGEPVFHKIDKSTD